MNILVIGCDQVGAALVRDLERIGHDISLIEKDPEQLKRATPLTPTSSSRAAWRTATRWPPCARMTP